MSFRLRILLAFLLVALVPLALFGWRVRGEMRARLDEETSRRVSGLVRTLETGLTAERDRLRPRLSQLGSELAADNRFRLTRTGGGDPQWLLDWASEAMRAAALDALVLQDSAGRILSSGQFRNDYGRVVPAVPSLVRSRPDSITLALLRTPEGARSVLAAVDSFELLGHRYTLLGGVALDSAALAAFSADPEVTAVLSDPDGALSNVAATVPIVVVDDATGQSVRKVAAIVHDPGPVRELSRRVDRWFLLVLGVTLLAAVVVAVVVARTLARPIAELAEKTERLDLDRLDVAFESERPDEIGALSRLLAAMTTRLRAGALRLRESERRAAVGDLARQVTHDIKNGLAPIRHALRHLGQTADAEPERLAEVFQARRATVESGVEYLDALARTYARLSPAAQRAAADPNRILAEVAAGAARAQVTVRTELLAPAPELRSDPVALRRVVENLVVNAVDAAAPAGLVTLRTRAGSAGRLAIEVADTGRGMTREELDRAFDDFFTTKPAGTGLGLSVVSRLVSDLGGSISVETEPGKGTTFRVELPTA